MGASCSCSLGPGGPASHTRLPATVAQLHRPHPTSHLPPRPTHADARGSSLHRAHRAAFRSRTDTDAEIPPALQDGLASAESRPQAALQVTQTCTLTVWPGRNAGKVIPPVSPTGSFPLGSTATTTVCTGRAGAGALRPAWRVFRNWGPLLRHGLPQLHWAGYCVQRSTPSTPNTLKPLPAITCLQHLLQEGIQGTISQVSPI